MPRFRRHRSSSAGSYHEGTAAIAGAAVGATKDNNRSNSPITMEDWGTAKELLHSLLYMTDAYGKGFLHTAFQDNDLHMAKCLLERCRALDERDEVALKNQKQQAISLFNSWQGRFLGQPTVESGYTPLHAAIVAGDLAAILLYLQYSSTASASTSAKPMWVLQQQQVAAATINSEGARSVVDAEGLTPLDLMGKLQTSRLRQCRLQLKQLTATSQTQQAVQRQEQYFHGGRSGRRSSSFEFHHRQEEEEEAELDVLRENMHLLGTVRDGDAAASHVGGQPQPAEKVAYAFEVVTFGRPHHCALGVISSTTSTGGGSDTTNRDSKATVAAAATTFRPQRVQEFAQERVLREGSAVAVSAAAHHTLVACRNGQLYVFGLNKGGRLGLGDDCPQQCPLPRRILSLKRKHVVAIAAAENHSLCVTSDGMVWAWGNNQFGQLGDSLGNGNGGSPCSGATSSSRSLPKPVEELRKISCVAVAAGERHSVALSGRGEVYVWGNNTSGQLGVARRSGIQKVQRVETLWNSSKLSSSYQQQRKVAIAIAAADQSTLVLTAPVAGLAPVNSVYWWGHGNHVPMRVQFDNNSNTNQAMMMSDSLDFGSSMTKSQRMINPVAIACAKYHNAAVTSDGCVYTWGTSSESLGRGGTNGKTSPGTTTTPRSSSGSSHRTTALPQLVTGMLPGNGGGFVVSVSASEQHTAVVTDTGALFTWGVAHGKNVMGHEGVRWQPSPKRVPGVHRAVNVAVAKEHTVVLIGTTFPPIPSIGGSSLSSLESLSARTVARYVDLFNVIPILIMAEQNQSDFLIEYCTEFVRQNLDGVLNVGKKGVMNQYLNDMLSQSLYHSGRKFRDDRHHPFITDVITAGNTGRPTFHRDWLSTTEEWVQGCKAISQSSVARQISAFAAGREQQEELARATKGRGRRSSSSCTREYEGLAGRARAISYGGEYDRASKQESPVEGVLDTIINKTAKMDLSSSQLAHENSRWLGKEIRGVRKKLNQIAKLRDSEAKSIVLTTAEQAKVDRQPVLEAELHVYETALEEVERRIRELVLEAQQNSKKSSETMAEKGILNVKDAGAKLETMAEEGEESCGSTYSCEVCGIKCPDKTSFELHQNGRKHRNRLAQVAEEAKQKVAKSIMEQKHLEQVKAPSEVTPPSVKTTKKNAWGTTCTPPPKFKLPPPPHPVVAQVTTPRKVVPRNDLSVSTPKASSPFSSPATAFPSILREQQGSSKKVASQPKSPFSKTPIWANSGAAVSSPGTINSRAPFHLHAAPDLSTSSTATSAAGQRASYSLADFLSPTKPPVPTPSSKVANKPAWSSSAAPKHHQPTSTKIVAKPVLTTNTTTKSKKSLAEIQAEEAEFKARQDRLYNVPASNDRNGDTSSWFIERRERADSLHAIQEAAAKERETQLMIQEQLAIEAQIHKELAAQKELQNKKGTPNHHGKNQKKKKSTTNKNAKAQVKNNISPNPKAAGDKQNSTDDAKSGHGNNKQTVSKKRPTKKKGPGPIIPASANSQS